MYTKKTRQLNRFQPNSSCTLLTPKRLNTFEMDTLSSYSSLMNLKRHQPRTPNTRLDPVFGRNLRDSSLRSMSENRKFLRDKSNTTETRHSADRCPRSSSSTLRMKLASKFLQSKGRKRR